MATNDDSRVGETVENYRLKSVLGTGSTSVVYLGQRLDDEHAMVAVKVLTFHDAAASGDRAAFRTRFLREARSVRKLRHDHILPVLSYGEVDDLTYMVLPLVTGGTLAARMTTNRAPLPLSEIAAYTRQLASALDYAHDQGIVHRDVKPSNVLLDEQGTLYLTDFGIARLFNLGANTLTATGQVGLTQTGQVLGTPYYMAPEQIRGEPVGPATDIYALGVVVYQLVTGQVPYQGDTPLAVALQHLQDDPCPPSLLRSGLPTEAEHAILRAMAKQPADRFARASELADALEQAVRAAQSSPAQTTPNDTRTAAINLATGANRTADPYQSLVGTTLGSYRLEQLVGVSDLGAVFQARSGAEGALYRLRVLAVPESQAAESRSILLGRFQQLAHTVAELQHPYILPLLDYGSSHGLPYLVSPHVAGPSLAERLQQTGPMELLTAGSILDRLSAALEYAHEHGLLHRNLNTQCVYMQGNPGAPEIRVADFEVRRMMELGAPPAQSSTLYHTSEACAPEQLQGKPVDTYTDVYALGVVLYAMITGRPLFTGATKDDIAQQHLYSAPPPLRRWRAGLPAALENIVARALAKEPEQRFRHPAELASAYRQIVGSASGSYTFSTASPAASAAAGPASRPITSGSQPAFVMPSGQQAQAEANATLAASPGPMASQGAGQGRPDTAAHPPVISTPLEGTAAASGLGATMLAGSGGGAGSSGFAGSSNAGVSADPPRADPAGGSTPPPFVVAPAPPAMPPNRTGGPPRRGVGAAAAAVRSKIGLPAWALYLVTGVVLFALLFAFFVAAKGGGSLFGGGGAYADAQFTTPSGDVGFWANESLQVTASNLGNPPSGTQYVAWLMNAPNANTEPTQTTRLGPLTKDPTKSNTWTVTYNAKPYTNLMGQGNMMEIVEEDSSKPAPLTPGLATVVLSGTYPTNSYVHLKHLLLAFDNTPEHAGLLAAMRHQTFILQGEAQALKEAAYRGDSFAVSCHAQSVLDIIEGKPGPDYSGLDYNCTKNVTDQVGDGYGFLGKNGQGNYTYDPYIVAVEDHIQYAKDALPKSDNSLTQLTTHAPHVQDAMENVRSLLQDVQSDALKLKQNPGASDASNTSVDLASKVTSALQDSVPEGQEASPTQFGVVDAFNHTEYAATLRLTPPSGS